MNISSENRTQNGQSRRMQDIESKIAPETEPKERHGSTQRDVRFGCEHCQYKANTKQHLKMHTQAIHEGIRIPCDVCSYKATSKPNLLRHKQYYHEGVIFSCEERGHKSGRSESLKYHVKSVHTGEKLYKCNDCEINQPWPNTCNIPQSRPPA